MSNFVPEKVFLRGVLLHYLNMMKTATESHCILVEVYGEHALVERTQLIRLKRAIAEKRPEYTTRRGNYFPS